MQLLRENKTMLVMKDFKMSANFGINDASSTNIEIKEKRASNTSLLLMNPVASGDNVATDLNSAHRLKEDLPALVPCCEGKELQINEELVRSGLSAISVKHEGVLQSMSLSRAFDSMQAPPGIVKHRNSFRCLHRPELKRVPCLRRMTPTELEALFSGYDLPTRPHHSAATSDAAHASDNSKSSPVDEEVPTGKRLHGARGTLYTSVLAGDEMHGIATAEYEPRVPEDIPEDEVPLHEQIQIILPPRIDDVTAESSTTTYSSYA